jgi:hypothetical protein
MRTNDKRRTANDLVTALISNLGQTSNGPEDRTPPTGRLDHHTQLTCGWSSRPATLEVRTGGHNFGTTKTGYLRADFHDAWSRYLPPEVGKKGNGGNGAS